MAHSYGEGVNQQHRTIWDLTPDGGGKPQKLRLWSVEAQERIARDPGRYAYHEPEHGDMPPADVLAAAKTVRTA